MEFKIEPLQDRVIVLREEEKVEKVGSFYVPDVAKEKPQQGIVLAVGTGTITNFGLIPIGVEVGDRVLFGKYSGTEVPVDNDVVLILRADEIMGRFRV